MFVRPRFRFVEVGRKTGPLKSQRKRNKNRPKHTWLSKHLTVWTLGIVLQNFKSPYCGQLKSILFTVAQEEEAVWHDTIFSNFQLQLIKS